MDSKVTKTSSSRVDCFVVCVVLDISVIDVMLFICGIFVVVLVNRFGRVITEIAVNNSTTLVVDLVVEIVVNGVRGLVVVVTVGSGSGEYTGRSSW